jgi:hypothetical protein
VRDRDTIWKNPAKGEEILPEYIEKKEDVYSFEKMFEEKGPGKISS